MSHTDTVVETEAHAMQRLLSKARTEGIQLKRDRQGGYWATSSSQPGHLYAVTAVSCTCKGFLGHQRCKHLAALHAHLGWIGDDQPEPPTSPSMEVTHRPAGYLDDDLTPAGYLRWVPDQTCILVDGIEVVRVTGDAPATVVVNPGPKGAECTDVVTKRSHYDEVILWIRSIDPEANLGHLLGKADLWPADEFLDEVFEPAVA